MSDLTNAEKREIWMECWKWVLTERYPFTDSADKEALRRYPDPKPEPPIVRVSGGREYRILDTGQAQTKYADSEVWIPSGYTVSDFMGFGEIAQEYSERTK